MEFNFDIELAHLEAGLRINRDDLDNALMQQPEIFRRAGEFYALALSQRDGAKDDLKEEEARVYLRIRSEMQPKPTEPALDAMVNSDKSVVTARMVVTKANRDLSSAESLKEAFAQRAFVLKDLCGLYTAGYFQTASVRGTQRDATLVERNKDRAAIARGRQELISIPQPLQDFKSLGTLCSECGKPQFDSPSGPVCEKGHGGANRIEPPPLPPEFKFTRPQLKA